MAVAIVVVVVVIIINTEMRQMRTANSRMNDVVGGTPKQGKPDSTKKHTWCCGEERIQTETICHQQGQETTSSPIRFERQQLHIK